ELASAPPLVAVVVIVALDPSTRFKNTRDARRLSDIQSILTAVRQYIVDNKGTLPPGLSTYERQLGMGAGNCDTSGGSICSANSGTDCLNLSTDLEKYLKTIPFDPTGTPERTQYTLQVDANGIVTVRACASEDASISSISR
ncbi:MAG: hypothetical protein WCG73_03150, partial [Candidatus Moraniibacteriota bacterium]